MLGARCHGQEVLMWAFEMPIPMATRLKLMSSSNWGSRVMCGRTPNGVEAKVTCYFRRRDISNTLIQQAEKYCKCTVTLYNEVEPLTSYVEREDAFYYRLIYDPNTKRLQEDRGSMRIGSDFQCDIQPLLAKGEGDPRFKQNLEEILWNPLNSPSLSEMDTFISAVKAVGLYGRACDPASSLQNPLLINAAAAASRDVTLQFAHDILFRAGFDVQKAMTHLLPNGHPVVCKDELEMWTAHESSLFEEALGKQVKDFTHILTDSLPWKSSKSIVEMYYFWKTTDRYTRHRKNKMVTKEQKLKQVYIPDYSKPNSSVLYNRTDVNDRGCECCYVETSPQWYAWGPPNLMCRLCSGCWTYWKKYGGLKNPDKRAKSRIPALRDPQAVLKRKLPVRSLKSVVKKLLLRLGRNDDSAIITAPFKRSFDSASIAQNGDAANGVEQPAEKRPRIESVAQNCSSTNGRVVS
ncbi:Metastasis-associated protein MTA3 [Echinococcus granulosus]|uniref:Metastasis-associated protein MTA3 n=1 Tax=Echinococcus granulosus TaxID=6210 RepID=W6U4L7_ECHGR|nr:Metastasis-associated protein MTA3 [Echinococcus granulosus]EUB56070.1 Metastasis-associated protein MTA3 [Echinococcus granulosus]